MVQVLKVIQWSLYINLSVENFHCFIKGRVFNGSGKPVDKGPPVLAEDFLDIQGLYLVNFQKKEQFVLNFLNFCLVLMLFCGNFRSAY